MKIYTSYFGNARKLNEAGIRIISVALWKPRFMNVPLLAGVTPTRYMLSDECSHDEYLKRYDEILRNQDANQVVERIMYLSDGQDVALCCYEKPGVFCHRHILAKWITDNTGIEVEEFEETKKKCDVQASLF